MGYTEILKVKSVERVVEDEGEKEKWGRWLSPTSLRPLYEQGIVAKQKAGHRAATSH